MPVGPPKRLWVIALAALAVSAASGAQSAPGTTSAPVPAPIPFTSIPRTPAGDALRAWLDAFNSGDSTRIASFLQSYGSTAPSEQQLAFRRATGGFDLLSIEKSEPRHIEFYVREHGGTTTALGELDLPVTGPHRIDGPTLQALGKNVPVSAAKIDGAARSRVVARAAALLDSFYVFPDVARRMGDSARARLARGEYDGYTSGPGFAKRLMSDFAAISHDKHLNVRFLAFARPEPPPSATPAAPSAEDVARFKRDMEENNCDFVKVERLDGNVGYLKFDGFADADLCAPTVAAAMTFLGGTRALVIDLRQNGGGSPDMVALVASYLFDTRTHLNDLWTRSTDSTKQFFTRDTLSGRRYGAQKPVYLLTSSRTFSGAEEFAYDLKMLKRATLIGETTGGGAHPVRGRRIDEHFFIGVPFARAINPVSHTNWEGVGVEPDTKVPAADALAVALKAIGPTR